MMKNTLCSPEDPRKWQLFISLGVVHFFLSAKKCLTVASPWVPFVFSLFIFCKFVLEVFKVGLDSVQQPLPADFGDDTLFLLAAIVCPLS